MDEGQLTEAEPEQGRGDLVGTGSCFEELAAMLQSPVIAGSHPQLVSSACVLGVLLDSLLMLSSHIEKAKGNTFYHLFLTRNLHPILVGEDLPSVIHAFSTLWLDNNVIYLDVHPSALRKLQLVQNDSASLLSKTGNVNIKPVLHSLHWLPIEYPIKFQILALIVKVLHGMGPGYLKDHLKLQHRPQSA